MTDELKKEILKHADIYDLEALINEEKQKDPTLVIIEDSSFIQEISVQNDEGEYLRFVPQFSKDAINVYRRKHVTIYLKKETDVEVSGVDGWYEKETFSNVRTFSLYVGNKACSEGRLYINENNGKISIDFSKCYGWIREVEPDII